MKQIKKKQTLVIGSVICTLVLLLGFATWFILRPNKNVDVSSGNALGIEWYDEQGKEFTITTAEQLYEFAELSKHYDFSGQTIYLGADIVVNDGDADDWGIAFPENLWDQPIDGFAGTFDGQGHTISGLYCIGFLYTVDTSNLIPLPAGLFSNTSADCVIKNFKLVNSYFCGDLQDGAGTVSACGGGTFDSIYSSAKLVTYKYYNGGIIGLASESTTITNCWYDGEVEVLGGYPRYTAGMMGRAANAEADYQIEHCLVTSTMYNETEKTGVAMAGIVGNVIENATIKINDCFVDGSLYNEYNIGVGSIYGVSEKNSTPTITNTYATEETHEKTLGAILGNTDGIPVAFPKQSLTGVGGYQWTTLDFDKYWSAVEGSTPVLKIFAEDELSLEGVEKLVDISWYSADAKEFVLHDFADLYGFAILSQSYNFENQIVKLGADITVNTGMASGWGRDVPTFVWKSIGSNTLPFAGTFDGQMHTVSGIYLSAKTPYAGFFSTTATTAIVKNFKLRNSYFETSNLSFGSIAGRGRGTFDTVYSDAIVVSDGGNVGGIIGQVPGDGGVTMKNCWFAGSVTSFGNDKVKRSTGGLIGVSYSDSTVSNCLFTGTVDASAYVATNSPTSNVIAPLVGGLVGQISNKSVMTITDSLSTGKVKFNAKATGAFGSVIGWSESGARLSGVYASEESCSVATQGKNIIGAAITLANEKLTGLEGYRWTTLNFNKYWAAIDKSSPVLKSFAGKKLSVNGVAKMVDISWYNEKSATYVLKDAADLYGFAYLAAGNSFSGKTVKLGADIVVNSGNAAEWGVAAPGNDWLSIGSKKIPFAGTFDGQMHTISGIYLKTETNSNGLFGAVGENAVVKNLRVSNSYFESSEYSFGAVAGLLHGLIDTVYVDDTVKLVSSKNYVGGIAGLASGKSAVIRNCWFAGSVTNTANHRNYRGTAGILAAVYEDSHAKIEGCLNTGDIDVTAYTYDQDESNKVNVAPIAGGIVGTVEKASSSVEIYNCLNTGNIMVSDAATGFYGAIVGYTNNTKGTSVSESYTTVGPTSGSKITGEIYKVANEDILGYKAFEWTFLDFDKYWAVVKNSTPVLKSFVSEQVSLAGFQKMFDFSWMNEAKGTEEDPYKIKDAADLYGLAILSADAEYDGFKGKTILVVDDIEANKAGSHDYAWRTIGSKTLPFKGTFDGGMHTISGIYLVSDTNSSGMFGATAVGSVIKNIRLSDSYFESSEYSTGGIVGLLQGLIDTVYVDDTVQVVGSHQYVGGIAGLASGESVRIRNSWFAGSVTNTANHKNYRGTGGILGGVYDKSYAKIEGCLNTGTIDVTAYTYDQDTSEKVNVAPLAGGIVGTVEKATSSVDIFNCLNTKEVMVSDASTGFYGTIIGFSNNTEGTCVSDTYTTIGPVAGSKITGKIYQRTAEEISGYRGYQWTLLDFEQYWAVVLDNEETTNKDESSTPIIKAWAKTVPIVKAEDKMIDISWVQEADGSEANPYQIADKADLYGMAMLMSDYQGFADKYIELTADIVINGGNASDWDEAAPSYIWEPIGSADIPFAGIFNGNMHTISGIYCNATTENVGLFGCLEKKGEKVPTIQNLKIVNSYIKSSARKAGSVAGSVLGKANITRVYSEAVVESSAQWLGGFVGLVYNAELTLDECWFAGEVTSTVTTKALQCTGGFVGNLHSKSKLTATNCLNSGLIDVSSYAYKDSSNKYKPFAAGFVGRMEGNSTSYGEIVIRNSINTGTVVINKNVTPVLAYGPFVGERYGMLNIWDSAYVMAEAYDAKTISNITVSSSHHNVAALQTDKALRDMAPDTLKDTYNFDFDNVWATVDYATPVLKVFKEQVIDTSWYVGHESDETYILKDKADLYGLAALSQTRRFDGKTIKLGADIVVNVGDAETWAKGAPSLRWVPIGNGSYPFAGTFNGDMHSISGLYCNTTTENTGLFGCLQNKDSSIPTIQNLKIVNTYIKSNARKAGSVAGSVLGKTNMDSIYSKAVVESSAQWLGGFVGLVYNAELTMNNCWFAGSVTSTVTTSALQCTGGFVGNLHSKSKLTATNCLNSGLVDVSSYAYKDSSNNYKPFAGGFVGRMEGNSSNYGEIVIRNSINTGAVVINKNVTPVLAYGPFVGERYGMLNIWNSAYVMSGEYDAKTISNITESSSYHNVRKLTSETELVGKDVVENFGFEANTYWKTNSNDIPTLKSFTK